MFDYGILIPHKRGQTEKTLSLLILALATLQSASAISQYELENKPTQYQVAYNSPSETVYIDLSTISLAVRWSYI